MSPEHHVNVTPKGYDCLRVLSSNRLAYLDLTGSGNDTSANLLEMAGSGSCFVRLRGLPWSSACSAGAGSSSRGQDDWDELAALIPALPGTRPIVSAEIDLGHTSCGYSIPFFTYEGECGALIKWAQTKDEAA